MESPGICTGTSSASVFNVSIRESQKKARDWVYALKKKKKRSKLIFRRYLTISVVSSQRSKPFSDHEWQVEKARFSVILIVSFRNVNWQNHMKSLSGMIRKSWMGSTYIDSLINLKYRQVSLPWALWRNDTYNVCMVCWMPVSSLNLPVAMALLSQGAPAILPGWIPLSVPLVRKLASVTLTMAHALVCPTSQARPVTVVQMDTGIWSPAKDASLATVTPGPLTAVTATRQDALNLPGL